MEMIVQVLGSLFHPLALGVNIFGVVLGIIFGAMPGLNGVVGVALLLPLTYGLSPANGLMMLGGLYMGATYGGSISAILLNCPGTGEAACTALNGNPLARQGRAMEALSYSALSSGIGGMFGTLVMLFFTPVLAKMALKFGPPELFLVCLAGLAVVGSLMDKSMAKGFFAVGVGLVLSMVGMDTMSSNYRFTFGSADLQAGLNLIPVSVGFFAIAEMLNLMSQSGENGEICSELKPFSVREAFAGCLSRWWVILKSSVIGTIIGILPGTGGAIASFIAYGEAKRTSKEGALFGKGSIDGHCRAGKREQRGGRRFVCAADEPGHSRFGDVGYHLRRADGAWADSRSAPVRQQRRRGLHHDAGACAECRLHGHHRSGRREIFRQGAQNR